MVPISDLSRRLPEAGRLRFGVKSGKAMKAIGTWRATSHDEEAIGQVAGLYGGTPRSWEDAPTPGQWEVITESSELRIALPANCLGGTPIYELWSGGGCQRRCDGVACQVTTTGPDGGEMAEVPCICSAKGCMECDPRLRLSVILPAIRFGGVWRLETKSWNAVAEIPGMVELISSLQDRGLTRGLLALKHRKSVTAGQTHRFIVPVLGVDDSLDALASGSARVGALPPPVRELEEGDQAIEQETGHVADVGSDNDVADAEVVQDSGEILHRLAALPSRLRNRAEKLRHDAGLPSLADQPTDDALADWDRLVGALEAEAMA